METMNKKELIDLMNQLCALVQDTRKLSNDFAEIATQVAALISKQQED